MLGESRHVMFKKPCDMHFCYVDVMLEDIAGGRGAILGGNTPGAGTRGITGCHLT